MKYRKVMNCDCGKIKGKVVIPHSHSLSFGITVKDMGSSYDGVFVDNKSFSLENNFCPQCGTKISEIVEEK